MCEEKNNVQIRVYYDVVIYIYLIRHFSVQYCCIFLRVMQYFGKPKYKMMSKNLQRYYTLKCLKAVANEDTMLRTQVEQTLVALYFYPNYFLVLLRALAKIEGFFPTTFLVITIFSFLLFAVLRHNNNNNLLLGNSITRSGLHEGPNTRYILYNNTNKNQ